MKILVVKLSSLGDLFHALPAVHNLRVKLNAQIDWVTQREYVDLVRCFSDVNRVISFHRRAPLSHLSELLKELRREQYDYVIDFQGLLKSAVIGRLARGAKRIGPSFHREGAHFFYTGVAGARQKDRHAVEENLDVIRHLGLDVMNPEFPLSFPARKFETGRPRLGILPASRWVTKNWPPASFIELGRRLMSEQNLSLYIFGGSADVELCAALEKGLQGKGNVTNLAGKLSIAETGGALKDLDLLISNDTGPMHIAAAVGTPVLALFGPTESLRTGPFGGIHRIMTEDIACRPCYSRTCSRGDIACLSRITPERVFRAAVEMLGKVNVRP